MAKAVFGIAKTEEHAVHIINRLKEAGFSNNDVSVLLPDRAATRDFPTSSTRRLLKALRLERLRAA